MKKYFLKEVGEISYFAGRFFKEFLFPPYEFKEFLRQCYYIGNRSLFLVGVTGFIIGLVFTLQSRPTLQEFGAVSWMASMVSVSIIREIGPTITALICDGSFGNQSVQIFSHYANFSDYLDVAITSYRRRFYSYLRFVSSGKHQRK